jgi:FtsP/CotA-like multicopper oxidase with cupredoxin domain
MVRARRRREGSGMDTYTTTTTPHAPPGRSRRRRPLLRVLVGVLLLGLVAVLGLGATAVWLYAGADTSNVGRLDFANRLKIPPLLTPHTDATGTKTFNLRLQPGNSQLLPGHPTPTWGANGPYLGPTLHANRGDTIRINVHNTLPQPTTLHWHGMHLPPHADGGPHQPINPNTTWSPSWKVNQPAATLWYHPHPHGHTADHLDRGIAGLFLLDDPQATALALPHRYGLDDIPLIIQDKRFHADGRLDLGQSAFHPIGRLGGEILVNGTRDPHLDTTSRLVRFRLLNASTARSYNLGFSDGRAFDLIGTDGGLLDRPYRLTRAPLSPGERAEIVVAFAPGERPVLRSFPPDLGVGGIARRFVGGDDTFDVLQVRAAGTLRASAPLPARLVPHPAPDQAGAARTRHFELDDFTAINGRSMEMGRIDQVVTAGTSEIWEVSNHSGNPHNFHVHGVRFEVVGYPGGTPPTLAGWKDTVALPPGRTVRLLVHFGGYADPASPYMFHCHLLRHEDSGMMGQFVTVRPGQAAALPAAHQHHG